MDRKAYIDQLANQLKEWDTEISNLETKVKEASSSVKEEYNFHLKEIKTKKNELNGHLEELRDTTSNAWDDIRNSVELGLEDIKKTWQKTRNKTEEETHVDH